jgi:hypothetical protein
MWFQAKSYRPELHYMRGPGPKWCEKHLEPALLPSRRGLDPLALSWLIPAAMAVLIFVVAALTLA